MKDKKVQIVQIGLCTADLASTVRTYIEGFGFKDAGARISWGGRFATAQGVGDDATAAMWWVIGRQRFFNLEFIHHSLPPQRPLPADWRPDSLGWVRWGFATADFDACITYLKTNRIYTSEIITVDGLRRTCFRDPHIGVFVELMEEGGALMGWADAPRHDTGPRVVYATLSVPDLTAARTFYADAIELTPIDQQLHTPDMEALWELPGAKRETVILDGGRGVFLELVQYDEPSSGRRVDLLVSDQGIMNIAVGTREREATARAIDQAVAAGATLNAPLGATPVAATFVNDPHGNSLELLYAPEAMEASFGWKAQPPLFR